MRVVIPTYISYPGKKRIVRQMIEGVLKHQPNCQLVIVDDASPIQWPYLKKVAHIYIGNEKNLGYPKTSNIGLRRAVSDAHPDEIVCLANDDLIVYEDRWLATLSTYLNETMAFVSPAVYHESIDEVMGWEARHPNGCCIVAKASTWQAFNFLSEDYGNGYFEDTDLLVRVEQNGKMWKNVSEVCVAHVGQASFGKLNHEETFWASQKMFIKKWGFDPLTRYYPK